MSFLFDTTSPTTNPADTEALNLGAQRIRELKDRLQVVVGSFLNGDLTWQSNIIPAASIQNGITGAQLAALTVSNGNLAGGIADNKLVTTPIHTFTSTLQTVNASFGSVASVVHGLGGTPTFARWVLVYQGGETFVSGVSYSVGDELSSDNFFTGANLGSGGENQTIFNSGGPGSAAVVVLPAFQIFANSTNIGLNQMGAAFLLARVPGTSNAASTANYIKITTSAWKAKGYALR